MSRTNKQRNKQKSLAKRKSRPPQNNSPQEQKALVAVGQQFSGPLPPPEMLAQYDDVTPGAGDRIIAMAEAQSAHRRAVETKGAEAQVEDFKAARAEARLGQVFAFIIAVFGILAGACVIHHGTTGGAQIAGCVIGGVPLATIVTTFICGKRAGGGETEQK